VSLSRFPPLQISWADGIPDSIAFFVKKNDPVIYYTAEAGFPGLGVTHLSYLSTSQVCLWELKLEAIPPRLESEEIVTEPRPEEWLTTRKEHA
jgi:hypothetical protein